MTNLLKFLIFSLETIDGKRGSSIKLFENLMRQEQIRIGEFYEQNSWQLMRLEKRIRHQLMRKILTKYILMRVR